MNLKKKKIIIYILIILLLGGIFIVWVTKTTKHPSRQNQPTKQSENTNTQAAPKIYPDTIPAMSDKTYSGSDLKLTKVLASNKYYTRYAISYKSEGLTISGAMNIPNGQGPFPILILNHGYFDPETYQSGSALPREQDFFAKNGYITFLSDYRNYAKSDSDPNNDVRPRAGYVEDVINGINAIKKADLDAADKNKIVMLGHSMGGGITLNIMVIQPDIAKAYALLAPISADYKTNFDQWVSSEWPDIAQKFYDIYGTYEQNPDVWESLSAKNYFAKITKPILLQQGIADSQVPVQWSRDLAANLKEAGKDVTYYEYPGEDHVFGKAQDLAMQRTLKFFNAQIKK